MLDVSRWQSIIHHFRNFLRVAVIILGKGGGERRGRADANPGNLVSNEDQMKRTLTAWRPHNSPLFALWAMVNEEGKGGRNNNAKYNRILLHREATNLVSLSRSFPSLSLCLAYSSPVELQGCHRSISSCFTRDANASAATLLYSHVGKENGRTA